MYRTVVLPAYNESGYIDEMVRRTIEACERSADPFEIIVVDNASTDSTAMIVRQLENQDGRVRLIRHPENRLYAGSCLTGARAARGDRIFIVDSDGQHSPDDLWSFDAALDDGADIVFGWRRERQESLRRRTLSRVLWLLAWWYLRFPLHDVNCGFRAFTKAYAEKLEIKHKVNFVNPELYVRAVLNGFNIGEASTIQERRKAGTSSHDLRHLTRVWRDVNAYLSSLSAELHTARS